MIERKFIEEKKMELKAMRYLDNLFKGKGYSRTEILKIPTGHRIIIYTSRPGYIIGRKGERLDELRKLLEEKFHFENPQIEVREVENKWLDPKIVADAICNKLKSLGVTAFKGIGHRAVEQVMRAGAIGVEIELSGKLPSDRAHTWKFRAGYLPKSGEVAKNEVLKAKEQVLLKVGIVGVKVKILPPNVVLPDKVEIIKEEEKEEVKEVEENILLE